jgi:hypothetical protein
MFATDSWYSCAAHAQLRGESLPPMVIADGRWSCGKKLIGQGNLTGFSARNIGLLVSGALERIRQRK